MASRRREARPHAADQQARAILDSFSRWLKGGAPNCRRVVLKHGPNGFTSSLEEARVSTSATLADATAQSGTVCLAEVES